MLKVCKNLVLLGLALVFLLTGCGLISITFLLDEDIDETFVPTSFYYYGVDVTDEEDWEDHKDDIKQANWVTFELYLTNPGGTDITFDGYVDDATGTACTNATCAMGTTKILSNITIPAGSERYISPGESLNFMENMDILRDLAVTGMFNFYGVSTGGSFVIDSGRVVVAIVAVAS
ncbi:MAG: hypothetical protein JSU74_07930 [Candidatus Zixiibacteriota bacterium]|nr:MAG: hypothetical protein JSU74_07930 [candidate division Zixibacteria bacterium]